ncbi:MAG: hypothetical protein K8E66_05300 [Phycisphaerales bacterium]|nr:hypothetical protein [Phycisphaerales bacterium]
MDVSGIRQEVEAAVRLEAETGTLRGIVLAAVRRTDPDRSEADAERLAERGVALIREFVASAPTVIEATMQAAEEAGVVEAVRPIFETALSYMHEEVDFIPDSLGLAGMMDDAYLIHGLMQEISERHRVMTGRALLPSATFADMQEIKRLIGDPTATRLDVAIVAFARRQNVRETIEQILRRIGGAG